MTSRPWIYVLGQVLGQVLGLEAEAKAHGSQKKLFGVAHVTQILLVCLFWFDALATLQASRGRGRLPA